MIHYLQNCQSPWELSVEDRTQKSMENTKIELCNLDLRQLLFEGISNSERRDKIMRVHQHMNKRIQECTKHCCSSSETQVQQQPPHRSNGCMVVHVKKTQLRVLLPHAYEERVEEIKKLAEIVYENEVLVPRDNWCTQSKYIGNRNSKDGYSC